MNATSNPTPDSIATGMSGEDFDALDDILDDLRTRYDETPQWEFCEGFMAALICCRRLIMPSEYLPVLLFLIAAIIFAVGTLTLSTFIVPRRRNSVKNAAYECGVDPVGDARQRVTVKFYLVAVLFILFDIEAVFLYPWAVTFRQLGLYGLIEMILFIVILMVGYLYLIKKRALEWE
jgi:NADH-quinone oxidoreductase subunit A